MAESVDEGRWELDRESLDTLLLALDRDRNSAGRRYELLRRKLIDLFAWRGAEAPEELTDETLNRLARRLSEGTPVDKVESYALGIARLLLLEWSRRREQRSAALREIRNLRMEAQEESAVYSAFEQCLSELTATSRILITRYYTADRAALATELGLSYDALRARAMRIRRLLHACVMRRHKK